MQSLSHDWFDTIPDVEPNVDIGHMGPGFFPPQQVILRPDFHAFEKFPYGSSPKQPGGLPTTPAAMPGPRKSAHGSHGKHINAVIVGRLCEAAEKGDLDQLRDLMENAPGATGLVGQPNRMHPEGWTVMHQASHTFTASFVFCGDDCLP